MTKKIDRTGRKYGRLLVVREADHKVHPSGNVSIYWLCKCDCGTEKAISGKALASGVQVSCGCYNSEIAANRMTTHGESASVEYRIFRHMIGRCYDLSDKGYGDYGGRGIFVCDEWRNNFPAFLEYVGRRPSPSHSIDRINNDDGYKPGNVRWATATEQANNKRLPKRKTHCKYGHELTDDNVYVQQRTGYRQCITCRTRREKERQRRNAIAQAA